MERKRLPRKQDEESDYYTDWPRLFVRVIETKGMPVVFIKPIVIDCKITTAS